MWANLLGWYDEERVRAVIARLPVQVNVWDGYSVLSKTFPFTLHWLVRYAPDLPLPGALVSRVGVAALPAAVVAPWAADHVLEPGPWRSVVVLAARPFVVYAVRRATISAVNGGRAATLLLFQGWVHAQLLEDARPSTTGSAGMPTARSASDRGSAES